MSKEVRTINVAVAGIGNCASALIEGLCYYRSHPETTTGLLFPELSGYSVHDINIVAAFDISSRKVGLPVNQAIYRAPNNFIRIPDVAVDISVPVLRAPTLDGNPAHLAVFVDESPLDPVDVPSVLRLCDADILVNLLPTGSNEATEFYAQAALQAHCAFINCIPTPCAQRDDFHDLFTRHHLPLFGDDIKSQMGTTILHRALLSLLQLRGSRLNKTSQINVGGNTDFANFVYRSETKLISKAKSLRQFIEDAEFHVGHHYDPTNGPLKTAFIEIETTVFAGSKVRIGVRLDSDDKPNCAGSVVDLIRIAKGALDAGLAGRIPEACAFYMKSPAVQMADSEAFRIIRKNWTTSADAEERDAVAVAQNVG